jgi:hypothetical protein
MILSVQIPLRLMAASIVSQTRNKVSSPRLRHSDPKRFSWTMILSSMKSSIADTRPIVGAHSVGFPRRFHAGRSASC